MPRPVASIEELRERFHAGVRVCKGARPGTVWDVALMRGLGVVYVVWDVHVDGATSPCEAVVASQLRKLEP